jgi:1,4-dihydroxy-2-naphthoate octaprenyltransferase
MMVLPYFITIYLIVVKFFTPVMLIVLLAIPTFLQYYPVFLKPKPAERPEGQPGWPLYFVGYAFYNNRKFGSLFMLGLLVDVLLRAVPFTSQWIANFWG